jgi:hypothetical protein
VVNPNTPDEVLVRAAERVNAQRQASRALSEELAEARRVEAEAVSRPPDGSDR